MSASRMAPAVTRTSGILRNVSEGERSCQRRPCRRRWERVSRAWRCQTDLHCTKRERFVDTLSSKVRPDGHHEESDLAQPVHRKSMFFRAARRIAAGFHRARSFAGGFLIGLSAWTPVFVATAAEETVWQPYGLPGGIALFAAGVWLRVGKPSLRGQTTNSRNHAGPTRPGGDRLAA